jgi:hypothetical protein
MLRFTPSASLPSWSLRCAPGGSLVYVDLLAPYVLLDNLGVLYHVLADAYLFFGNGPRPSVHSCMPLRCLHRLLHQLGGALLYHLRRVLLLLEVLLQQAHHLIAQLRLTFRPPSRDLQPRAFKTSSTISRVPLLPSPYMIAPVP